MASRPILAGLLLLCAVPACAQPARGATPAFEQRIVAILNAGGTADTIQGRLTRVGADPDLTVNQRVAVDALRTLVRSRGKPSGLSIAEAEAFAARNPGSPASALLIAEAALANDQPQRSADALIAAAPQAGSLMQLVSPTMISRLSDELDALSDKKRTSGLAKVLLGAGWGRGSASLRSYLAVAAIREEVAAGRFDEARRYLPAVRNPASMHLVLIDNRLAPLRADVERVAGPRLERAWRDFLTGTRDEWIERGDVLSATAYAEALRQATLYDALATAFLGRFTRGYNCPTDSVARSIGDALAESLAKIGRWSKAEDVMRRSGGVSLPVYGTMLLERGEFGRAQSLFERSLQSADPPEGKTEEKALAWLQAARDCAAWRAGNRSPSTHFDPNLLDVSSRLFVFLCMDRTADAAAALIAALADEEERADALRWVQPFADPAQPSRFRQEMNARIRALQRDPKVIAEVSRYGVILDWPVTVAVPSTASLGPAKSPAWQCGDQADWQGSVPQPDSIRLPDSNP